MQGRLAFSLNDDGTVTLRCDADAFFAHANTIRRLLTGATPDEEQAEAGALEPSEIEALWQRLFPVGVPTRGEDISRRGLGILAAGYYLTQERGFQAFTRSDVQQVLDARGGEPQQIKAGTLVHLAKRGWLERVRRGAYRLARRAVDRLETLQRRDQQPSALPPPRARLPRLSGLSRFLREVPTSRKWRRVLLVIYFLQEHCGVEELDHHMVAAVFQRLRGVDAPGSLSALMSQTLARRHGLLEKAGGRGNYRLTPRAMEDLRKSPRIAKADAIQRGRLDSVAATG
jgi:hypothetical protein